MKNPVKKVEELLGIDPEPDFQKWKRMPSGYWGNGWAVICKINAAQYEWQCNMGDLEGDGRAHTLREAKQQAEDWLTENFE